MKKKTFTVTSALLLSFAVFAQTAPKAVGLLWDSSYGMATKNLGAELNNLNTYFKTNPNVTVQLTVFSNTVVQKETYTITGGKWEALKNELKAVVYDGTSSFQNIFPQQVDEVLLFSNGRETRDKLPLAFAKPITAINSVKNANVAGLRLLTANSGGTFLDLSENDVHTATDPLTPTVKITGVVKDELGPLPQVRVSSQKPNTVVTTDAKGRYTIEVEKGGILEFSHLGKNTVVVRAPTGGVKNITMQEGYETLEEVVIEGKRDEEIEEEVFTGNTKRSKRTLGYAVEQISNDDIKEQDIHIENAVTGQFSGFELKSDQNLGQFLARGKNMSILGDQTGIIVVDGVPVESDPSALALGSDRNILSSVGIMDPSTIESITLLKGLAATNKYGTLGRNGVLVIKTKLGIGGKRKKDKKQVRLGTTATYNGNATVLATLPDEPYLKALENAEDVNQAYATYLQQRKTYGNDPSFYINTASYFRGWGNALIVSRILSNVSELDRADPAARLALSYKYEAFQMYPQAVNVLERLVKEAPNQIQLYRNLALAYRNAGMFKKAKETYNKMTGNLIAGADFGPLGKSIATEYKNLVSQHKGAINTRDVPPFYLDPAVFNTRIVFEWNRYGAMFDLQIVNPQKRFFTWSHTPQAETARFADEQRSGYGMEEYFLTSGDTGQWLFNLRYDGLQAGNGQPPLYVKVTTYTNFGKPNQSKTVKVVPIVNVKKHETILTLKI
ncbi:MAG: carboxypeptidase-like regulatory domain-containing protein [Marinirhabdus sp.]